MDEAEKRRLKKLGKARVERQSRDVERMSESAALERFVLHPIESRSELIPVPTWYLQCTHCRDLLHSEPSAPVSCQCGTVTL